MFQEKIKQYVLDNPKLVSMKPAGDNIFVLKYRKTVFYNNLWNEFLEHCRGTIVDSEFNLVSYPFQKIYNFGIEQAAPVLSDETKVTAFRKVNGFMVAVTVHNGELLVSTTGSASSDFVAMAKELMLTHMCWADWCMMLSTADMLGMTFMFEACHKNDPHIIPEKEGLHILGYRKNSWGSKVGYNLEVLDNLAEQFNCHRAQGFATTVGELVNLTKTAQHEGYVAYTDDGQAFKIKSPYYLIQKALARKKDILSLNKEVVDEEYFPLIDHLLTISDQFNSLDEQSRLNYIRSFLNK
jgi:hypothetical protein